MTKDNTKELTNTKLRDSSAKIIFKDPILCAQFLRDYVDIPILKDVEPEDIEDETDRFVHLFTEERDSDVVKKIRLVSLIEHKSDVDYNVVMQIFRYMAFIWEDYEKEQNREHKGISRTKDFKYPPILPVVYYEGKDNWTAATRLHDRVFLSDMLSEYIPDYRCIMMQLNKYTNRKLMEKEDELSVIMMINKLQRAAEFTEQVKERKMGELFANFEAYDVQATRAEARAEERKKNIEEAIEKLIKVLRNLNVEEEIIKAQLKEQYNLSEEETAQKVALYK